MERRLVRRFVWAMCTSYVSKQGYCSPVRQVLVYKHCTTRAGAVRHRHRPGPSRRKESPQ
ncbi:hypothetical protein GCM10010270_17870 [Streptomyces violaceus]|nr:hypothetical protein GCM10010270_17870 [Streptomyces janthinus]